MFNFANHFLIHIFALQNPQIVSISPQSHRADANTSSSTNNCNASLPREGYACVVACCTVRHSRRRRLLRSCGISDGSVDFANNYNVSLPRKGYACATTCCTVRRFRHRRLLRSCGVSDGLADFVCCLAHNSLCRQLRRSPTNFDVSWLNFAGTLTCETRFSK